MASLFFASLSFIACKDTNKANDTTAMEEHVDMDAIEDMAESMEEDSMAWAGVYEGKLPCADCEAIETVIVLNDDNTYHKSETYLKGETASEFEEMGVYEWDAKDGTITLNPSEEYDGESRTYHLEEQQLVALKPDGSKVEGDMADLYVLKKL